MVFRAFGLDFEAAPMRCIHDPADSPAQCRPRVWVIRWPIEAFRVRLFKCRLADALLSSDPGRWQGTLSIHNVTRDCLLVIYYLRCGVPHFQLDTSPLRGAVGSATFRYGYSSFSHFSPRHVGGPREVLA